MTFRHDVQIHFREGSEGNRALSSHEGMSLDAIHEDLMRVLGENSAAYSTVTKYLRSEKCPPKNDGPPSQPMAVERGPVHHAILTGLAD
jgi:hypothetical protein